MENCKLPHFTFRLFHDIPVSLKSQMIPPKRDSKSALFYFITFIYQVAFYRQSVENRA